MNLSFIKKFSIALFSAGIACWVEKIVLMEWTFAYCNNQEDGLASAVFGMPFPYTSWGLASSLEYNFMPHVYLLNLVIIFTVIYFCLRPLSKIINQTALYLMGAIGAILIVVHLAFFIISMQAGMNRPVLSIGNHYGAYFSFRPIGLVINKQGYECKPSRYWFPNDWKYNAKES